MSFLVEVPVEGGGRLVVQAPETDFPADLELAELRSGDVIAWVGPSLEEALRQIQPAVQAVRDGLALAGPDEATVQFGIVLGAQAGVVVAKGSSEVHFAVTLTWHRRHPRAGGDHH
jgi:hypothetical protein